MNQYDFQTIILQEADGSFWGYVPQLPGCHSQGKTLNELKDNLSEAIQVCLEAAQDNPSYQKKIRLTQPPHQRFFGIFDISVNSPLALK